MLDLISFVGVDEKTNLNELLNFDAAINAGEPSFGIEYGFLFSVERSQTADKRYPSLAFIGDAIDQLAGSVATSVHLCGADAIGMYLDGDKDLLDLCANSRIQLNFKMSDYEVNDILDKVIARSKDHNAPVILQSNKSKKDMIDELIKRSIPFIDALKNRSISFDAFGLGPAFNIDLLYDGSGGFGREIEVVEPAFSGFYTGYAGGLKPSNVYRTLGLIDAVNPIEVPYYIDMESGIREADYFSLTKCQAVVDEVLAYEKAHLS
jgi:hypothetical protein